MPTLVFPFVRVHKPFVNNIIIVSDGVLFKKNRNV